MRVTFVSEEWRRNGGVGAYVRRLAAAMVARGDAVQVLHSDAQAVPVAGVEDVCVAGATEYVPGAAPSGPAHAAMSAVAAFRPDVVHVQSCNNFVFEGAIRSRYRATKTLHVFDFCPSNTKYHHALDRDCTHPTSALCLPRMGYKRCTTSKRPGVWLRLQRRAEAANRNNAGYARLIVASEDVRRKALSTGYPEDQVRVVPYFVETSQQPVVEPEPRTILTAGRLVREKGFDLFIDALAHVPGPWTAIIAGDGMERASLEAHARRARLQGTLHFAGWQDDAGMDALYARAAVVAMPSRWPEPSGIVGLEGMAHGRASVAFAVGGIPEWLDDGVTGHLVAPRDSAALGRAIASLFDDPAMARRMGEAGRVRAASHFSAAGHLNAIDHVYASLSRSAS